MRPKVVRSVHYCPQTKKTLIRRYTDLTSLDAFPSSTVYPTKVFSTLRKMLAQQKFVLIFLFDKRFFIIKVLRTIEVLLVRLLRLFTIKCHRTCKKIVMTESIIICVTFRK